MHKFAKILWLITLFGSAAAADEGKTYFKSEVA